jgi:hypothetical protein
MRQKRLKRIGEMPSHQFKFEGHSQKSQKPSDFFILGPISATVSHQLKLEHHDFQIGQQSAAQFKLRSIFEGKYPA